jgi:hypothetical protein
MLARLMSNDQISDVMITEGYLGAARNSDYRIPCRARSIEPTSLKTTETMRVTHSRLAVTVKRRPLAREF